MKIKVRNGKEKMKRNEIERQERRVMAINGKEWKGKEVNKKWEDWKRRIGLERNGMEMKERDRKGNK